MEEESDPYMMGWSQGRNDELPDCPFTQDSEDYIQFWVGYHEGTRDC